MAFEVRLIAIKWLEGNFTIKADTYGSVSRPKLLEAYKFNDISRTHGYTDLGCILTVEQLVPLAFDKTLLWLDDRSKDSTFILVLLNEWESGLGDD